MVEMSSIFFYARVTPGAYKLGGQADEHFSMASTC